MHRVDDYQGLGRHYDTAFGWLPSVSTVLRATGDRQRLDDWIARVGPEAAEAIRDAGALRGKRLHAEVDDSLLLGLPSNPSPWLESILPEVEEMMQATDRVSEHPVVSKKYGYAGSLDQMGVVRRRRILWEVKTYLPSNEKTRRQPPKKKREHCEDYLLQNRAYAKAAGSTMHVKVDEIRVVIARCSLRDGVLRPLPCQVLAVNRDDPEYAQLWSSYEMRLGLWRVYRASKVA